MIKTEERKMVLLDLMNHKDYKPMKIKEIAMVLNIPAKERDILNQLMEDLIHEGKIVKTKRGKFSTPEQINILVGRFIAHPRGYGFVEIENADNDIFIPIPFVNGALHEDKVAIKLIRKVSSGKRQEGEVLHIIERGKKEIIGTYDKNKSFGFVIPDNRKFVKDIFIAKADSMGAVSGHKVVVKIQNFGNDRRNPEGKVVEILGHINDPDTDILAIIKSFRLPTEFPKDVMKALNDIPLEVDEKSKEGRLDLRHLQTVTIDGEDAKDLDDAITIECHENGSYTLGVHIADVTHYVTEGSPLDKEALKRGTSVYLVDRVIPMLPHKLSNGICSLNAGEDRLALSCLMNINEQGNVLNHQIVESVIHVNRRLSYTIVKKILEDRDDNLLQEYKELVSMLIHMQTLAAKLRKKRKVRGSINFDFPESKIKLNEKGEPIEIMPYDRNVATKIIEEFMLLCNETIAENFYWQELPFVYRTHEEPDHEKIQNLGQFIYNFGYHMKGKGEIHPKQIQKLLIDVEGKQEEVIISRLALRSMKQARYTTTNDGHFGLATQYYCHFTSPIRRYPDLQIHRIIKENLHGQLIGERLANYQALLPSVAKRCSDNERIAVEAERETDKLKKVEYMEKHIGETFTGVISGVTNWGMYVELPNTVEGLIHVHALDDDYYIYDSEQHIFVGERTDKVYRLGDQVEIKVVKANKIERTIDFELA